MDKFQWNEILGFYCVLPTPDGKDQVATLSCIPAIFSNGVNALTAFAGLLAVLVFIFAGFKYMNSAGDPKKLESARNNLIYSLIGLAFVLFSFFIIHLISYVTGVDCIKNFGFGCPVK